MVSQKEKFVIEKIVNLEQQIELLEKKIEECINYIEFLKAENKKLQTDIKLLEEENKRLQGLYKNYLQLQSKTEIVKQKLKKVIEKIAEIV
ncbi:MAG: hypothetical protein ACK4WJ_04310 [Endomicrobiia bacterium]